jgi:hypothetical protein
MNVSQVITELDAQIAKLQAARNVLAELNGNGAGRTVKAGPRRTMSAAARKRIAAAQRARWAKVRAAKKK